MNIIKTNSIQLAYETFGDTDNPCLVLITGLSEQMTAWPERFCRMLADAGLFVIRFDNRDTGLSTKLEEAGIPDLYKAWEEVFNGRGVSSPYTLGDMAGDVNGLLAALEIENAYICGFSLGGMIAQNMAFHFPQRMKGLICMGTSTGDLFLSQPRPEAAAAMSRAAPMSRDGFITHMKEVFEIFSGGSPLYDPECRAETAALAHDRFFYPMGFIRQSVAMLADGSRTDRLKQVRIPTLVIHGDTDALVPPDHGKAIADAVENARFVLVKNWGHGLDYPALWPLFTEYISGFIRSSAT